MAEADASTDTRARILDAAVEQLRRHGLAKTGVVDVARALGVSHAAIYRYFGSKAELLDAVAARWLGSVAAPLDAIAASEEPAPERLERWFLTLTRTKRDKATVDPELFATYHALTEAAREVTGLHVAHLRAQLARIIADGVTSGAFRSADPRASAVAVLDATVRFHHPHFVREEPPDPERAREVLKLVLAGLRGGS